MTLSPAKVSVRQFVYTAATRTFTAEISETNGLGRVYSDSCDEGLTVVGVTGKEMVFVVEDVDVDAEGDLRFWTLKSVTGGFTMTLFND